MSLSRLLHSLDHRLVDAKGDGDTEQGEQHVGNHADDTEGCQREQQKQGQAEHHTRLLGVPPVDQVINCRKETGGEEDGGGVKHFLV